MTDTLLTDALKADIQQAYRAWLEAKGFRPRRGQREMIAAVARTLTGPPPRLLVVEAGTGTGKTAGYCLPAIPLAQALGKRVIISTATVALQEQVVLRDLPDLLAHSGLRFSFALAKGRGRYVCLKRLDDRLRGGQQQGIPLFDVGPAEGRATWQTMLEDFVARRWDGELDTWTEGVDDTVWRAVTTDHRGCANNRCSFFRQCPFFKARAGLDGVDVIVANHDLVLADLALGGGAVLPEPEECIYVFDEAHHLPEKTQQHFSTSARLLAAGNWLDGLGAVLGSMAQRFGRPDALVDLATQVTGHAAAGQAALRLLHAVAGVLPFQPRDETLETYRFPLGRVPDDLAGLAREAAVPVRALHDVLERAHGMLQDVLAGEIQWQGGFEAEDWLPVIGQQLARAAATLALLEEYGSADSEGPMHARWVNRYENDLELVSAPIEPGRLLAEHLWSRCYAALCTSATLTALGRFTRFFERVGLEDPPALGIPSPFDYPAIATFAVPRMQSDPRDFAAHSREVAELLPLLIGGERSALVLFTSWRQLREVLRQLPDALVARMHVQGDGAKQALLAAHRAAIDAGEQSYLVGLASFAEGVDLPDDYCRHVVIAKLPFAVPDDPIDQAMAEWAEAQGRKPFFDIAVPDAAVRLVQACGRLIRHEGDYGRITLLDRRIVSQRYGRALLDSLPPFRRDLDWTPAQDSRGASAPDLSARA
ncbi:MAG: ATP-dependent DNA helicase DinG [Pseudomonadales bacterium]|nr:ATP-dependent DNA helicase DinG [Pseudomonadales bacterium]